jgi:hypothetical protein
MMPLGYGRFREMVLSGGVAVIGTTVWTRESRELAHAAFTEACRTEANGGPSRSPPKILCRLQQSEWNQCR